MGLLDLSNDPLMAMAMGLLNAGGPQARPVSLGQGLAQGYQGMQEAQQMQLKRKMQELELAKIQQAQADEAKKRAFLSTIGQFQPTAGGMAMANGQGPTVSNAATIPQQKPEFDRAGMYKAMMGVPGLESVGLSGYASLDDKQDAREARKQELLLKHDEAKTLEKLRQDGRIEQMQQHDETLKAIRGSGGGDAKTPYTFLPAGAGFMKGHRGTGDVQFVNVDGQRIIPASADPALQGQIAGAREGAQAEAKRTYNMGGINDVIDQAESILKGPRKPTGSGIGTMQDKVGAAVGYSPDGAVEAEQLRAIGGALVAKMPRMEGPQSNYDVENYKEMAGRVGDSTLPIDRRLGALQIVRDLNAKYDKGRAGAALSPKTAAPPSAGRTATLADIAAIAKKYNKTTAQVTSDMKAKGYTIGGQ